VVKYIARGGRQVSDLAHRRRRDGDLGGAGVRRWTPAPLEPTLERSRGQVGTSPHVGRPSNNRGHLRAGERAGSVPVRGTREGTRPALERQRCRYAGRSGERTTGLEPATFGMVSSSARPPGRRHECTREHLPPPVGSYIRRWRRGGCRVPGWTRSPPRRRRRSTRAPSPMRPRPRSSGTPHGPPSEVT